MIRTLSHRLAMLEFVCIDCHKPTSSARQAKRCKECRRLDHNRRSALRMTAKRADPAFREADREATKLRMRRYRAARPAEYSAPERTGQTESASA
jgi:hypothetical protein